MFENSRIINAKEQGKNSFPKARRAGIESTTYEICDTGCALVLWGSVSSSVKSEVPTS